MLFGISRLAYTQVSVSGIVQDSATSEPLGLALLEIEDHNVVADIDGQFRLNNLPKGTHILYVSHVGCEKRQIRLILTQDTSIIVYLPHHLHAFEEVVTYAHQHNKEPDARLKEVVSSIKLEQKAAISISDALQNSNGVTFLRTGNTIAKPVINGMHSNRISIINDDSKQEGQQWGSEHAPEIDPLGAGSIEIIKGASTLLYGGDAMGGVIRILHAEFDDNSYSRIQLIARGETNPQGGQLGIKLERHNSERKLGQRLSINGKRNGDAQAPDYNLSNTGFAQGSGTYYLHKHWKKQQISFTGSAFLQRIGILSASHIGNLTDLNRALASDTPLITRPFTYSFQAPSQLIQHYSGKLKWEVENVRLGDISTSFTSQYNHRQEFDDHNTDGDAALDLSLATNQLNLLIGKHISNWKWQYGGMGERQQNTFKGRYFIPNYLRYKGGIFTVATLERDKYLIEYGVRYDAQNTKTYRYEKNQLINEEFNYNGLSGNISGWRKVSEDVKIHLSLATKFRAPDINELFSNGLHHGSAALEFGDKQLKEERSYSIAGAFKYNHNRLRVQAEPYFHYFNNYIYLKPTGSTQLSIRGAFPVFEYLQTDATYSGIDLDLRYLLNSHWIAQINSSLVFVKDIKTNTFIYGIPAQQVRGQLQYRFAEAWTMKNGTWSLSPRYTFKQKRVEENQDFAPTPEGYFLLNTEFNAYYKETRLFYALGINNILNTTYRDYLNRNRYYADELGINFYLTLNYTF